MSDTFAEQTVFDLLRETRIEVAPATHVLVGLRHQEWARLLESPELSPRSDSLFLIFRDSREVTLLLEEEDWHRIRHIVRDAKVEGEFRLVTFDIELPWNVVGYLARVTEILAAGGIPIGAISSSSRDHLLIKQNDLGNALRVLSEHVKELC
ncbi:MAG: ACT domain-containing protein [Pyrinomonadaceae bacterium]